MEDTRRKVSAVVHAEGCSKTRLKVSREPLAALMPLAAPFRKDEASTVSGEIRVPYGS
jgi:hypothetical protein